MFLHEREASSDLLSILSKHSNLPPIVVHCFTGTVDEMTTYFKKGYYVGLTGDKNFSILYYNHNRESVMN